MNGANIYSLQFGNSTDTLISTWKDGLMQEEVIKSKWGTVLNVKRYYYLPLGKVKEEERRFDFKEKKLKSAVEKIINISDLLSEDDLINPLKMIVGGMYMVNNTEIWLA